MSNTTTTSGMAEESAKWLEEVGLDQPDGHRYFLAASLLRQLALVLPEGLMVSEYWHMDSGARVVSEPCEEGPGGCWVVRNSRHISFAAEYPTAAAAAADLQAHQQMESRWMKEQLGEVPG